MEKRTVKFGTYDTASYGWTLTGWKLSDPEQKLNLVEKVGGDGAWDLSTTLTDGIPRYKSRNLTITLELSEGTRDDREEVVNDFVNLLDGFIWPIVLPDRPDHYLTGRVHVTVNHSGLSYASVTVAATVNPWFYCERETVIELTATADKQTYELRNRGRLVVFPKLTVIGDVSLRFGAASIQLVTGSHQWTALLLHPGMQTLEYSGAGNITIKYREAVLR